MSSTGAPNGAALGKRISEPRLAKRGAKTARAGEAQDAATSPPPFSPMSPTQQLTRAFSALPIIDTSSSSSDPPSSPGRAEQVAQQRAASLDALTMQAESKAKSPKSRPDGKAKQKSPEAQRKPERDRSKRQGDPGGAAPEPAAMLITPAAAPAASAPAPTPPGREREKKKLNLPSPGTGASRNGVSTPSASAATAQFTCPYCPAQLDEAPLIEHVLYEHMDANPRVVCPMCASRPGGDPKMRSSNFQGHLQARHGGQLQRKPRKAIAPPPPPSEAVEAPPNDEDEQEDESQREEQQLRWVLITTNANRLRDRSNLTPTTSLEGLWDYVLTFDPVSRPAKCVACSARLGPNDATCMLACGHSFHSGCLAENDPDPECPMCLSMGGDAVMKD